MDWYSFGKASKEFGGTVIRLVGILLIYVFTFTWITAPTFIALFPETLTVNNSKSEGEVIVAILLWIVTFIFHIGAFAYVTGIVMTNRDRIKDRVKKLYERIQDGRSRTD